MESQLCDLRNSAFTDEWGAGRGEEGEARFPVEEENYVLLSWFCFNSSPGVRSTQNRVL